MKLTVLLLTLYCCCSKKKYNVYFSYKKISALFEIAFLGTNHLKKKKTCPDFLANQQLAQLVDQCKIISYRFIYILNFQVLNALTMFIQIEEAPMEQHDSLFQAMVSD